MQRYEEFTKFSITSNCLMSILDDFDLVTRKGKILL